MHLVAPGEPGIAHGIIRRNEHHGADRLLHVALNERSDMTLIVRVAQDAGAKWKPDATSGLTPTALRLTVKRRLHFVDFAMKHDAPGEPAIAIDLPAGDYLVDVADEVKPDRRRAYLFCNEKLWQMTEDHSLINEQLRAGLITEADLPRLTNRNVITRSVGFEREVQVDIIERPMAIGDVYLMCSDGLSGLIDDSLIRTIIVKHGIERVEAIVAECITEAKKADGDDNVTVMVMAVTA